MSSCFGRYFRLSLFGQSHGPGVGVTLDGFPAGLEIDMEDVARQMARRAPGQSALTTPRKESDLPEILSGVFRGKTTGQPLTCLIRNENTRSQDYGEQVDLPRPGHGDYTGHVRYYGFEDFRGGGHFSARLTAPLVFAGALCRQYLAGQGISAVCHIQQLENILRNDIDLPRGSFRVKGDTIDIALAYADNVLRISFWGDEIDSIEEHDPLSGTRIQSFDEYNIYPANLFMTTKESTLRAIRQIEDDLRARVEYFEAEGKPLEAKRIYERVTYDMEMMRELGHCSGIENYSRYFDGRPPGSRPYCLLDFFPKDYLTVIDESHVSVPQIHAMYGGDRARKTNLVEYGFRLPAALDNRPLKFDEFESLTHQVIYVSATPAEYELQQSEGVVVEQIIRPTGLLDPVIEVRPSLNQIDDLLEEIQQRVEREERVLVTTLTKRMAEELTDYLLRNDIRCNYIHSDVDTLERVKIMEDLRAGMYDVLIGVNLLREGLDLPEVSLVAILDADKEGFLRSYRSLTQTAGRAARNVNGKVIMYADRITESMEKTITEANRRREKQLKYNEEHHITPRQIRKELRNPLIAETGRQEVKKEYKAYVEDENPSVAADPVIQYMSRDELQANIELTRKRMYAAAKATEFVEAARYRDELLKLEDFMRDKFGDG